jgi:hypothetical protein
LEYLFASLIGHCIVWCWDSRVIYNNDMILHDINKLFTEASVTTETSVSYA